MHIYTFPGNPAPFAEMVALRPDLTPQYAADVSGCVNGYKTTCGSHRRDFTSLMTAGRLQRRINEAVADALALWDAALLEGKT